MVAPRGFEPLISWLRTKHPRPLDEGAIFINANIIPKNSEFVKWELSI